MDILQKISLEVAKRSPPNQESEQSNGRTSPTKISILRAESSSTSLLTPSTKPSALADIEVECIDIEDESIFPKIKDNTLFTQSRRGGPVMNVLFFPKKQTGAFEIFEYLGLDKALFAYLLSSRSGWNSAPGNGQYSFMVKDYPYMLAWSFNLTTFETHGILAARSEFEAYSNLKSFDGTFSLPGLCTAHLYHPLSLACICLIDFVFYFDRVIVEEGYKIGDVENDTGHGLWVDKKSNLEAHELKNLPSASRNISRIIVVFANLFKSVEVAHTIIDTLEQEDIWTEWRGMKSYQDASDNIDNCTASFRRATETLKSRIKTIKQSGQVIDKRAEAQSNVIAQESKKIAEESKKDSSDMKVIAVMTMAFLPGTFFAALFAVPSLQSDHATVIQPNFWVYWVCTVPMTILVFGVWDVRNEKRFYPWRRKTRMWKRDKKQISLNSKDELEWHEAAKQRACQ
ncbi:hypothetical protein GGR53DRAFT_530101 [Hypoxylon sp. FL1150]|nr:hypothetical protein GGR53DRAFT_530101 [Hypoxylon sp. FL1150]